MAIGEVFLGAFVTVLLERLASRELLKFLRPLGIDAQLKKWRRTLLMIKAVLTDAENKQTRNEAVKEWLNDLEDLAYDLDDLVDKLNTEALQRKLMETDEESTSQVAKIMSRIPAYHLNLLSDNDALSLLAQHSLGTKTFDVRPDLREIGKSVVRRCQNLPLAVESLGGLLRTKASPKEWEGVLNSEIWIAEEKSEILPALKLSYQYLPPELKQCFALCAIFPKDYEFLKSELVYIWMAEGFLKQSQEERLMEELGNDYFDELLTRSFFQKSSTKTSRFVMHDLINDLAMCVSGYKCLRLDDMLKDNLRYKISEKVRHFSFISRGYKSYDTFSSVSSFQNLRTFLPLSNYGTGYLPRRVLHDVLPKLYCIRELSLSGYQIYELPSSIGDLRHLRYFNLCRTPLKWLPENVSTLCNLQVLILENCYRLSKLPARMDKLINLRHLNIACTGELREMSEGIARLTSLQTLSKLIVSKSSGLKINDLRDFSLLKGEISIEELQHVVNVQEATDARLTNKSSLNNIELKWSSTVEKCNEVVLNSMHNLTSLTQLKLEKISGLTSVSEAFEQFPLKLENYEIDDCEDLVTLWPSENIVQRPVNLQRVIVKRCPELLSIQEIVGIGSLHIENCASLELLPDNISSCRDLTIIKCPSLKMMTSLEDCSTSFERLHIQDWVNLNLTNLMGSFHNFSSLTELSIDSCDGLESFPQGGLPIPNLRELEIIGCRNLRSLPDRMEQLLSLHYLLVHNCPSLTVSFHQRNIPPNLISLQIHSCGVKPLGELDLHKLTSLKFFGLGSVYPDLVSFSNDNDQHYLLPPSLKILKLQNLPNLETLSKGFQNLTSLQYLNLRNCPKLVALPMEDQLYNLRSLIIKDCPLLKKRCLRNEGDFWPIIADIPDVEVDGCSIYDLESCP
ncbi:putative disease resistance RPP13-like protein 1 [Forsythia ovata]|uniref:Disease resistance RPP13-like protein 1 n=1 Tax=Forsythia ovata TaxID=205694 RepID=A0ABD1W7P6_9LAMI